MNVYIGQNTTKMNVHKNTKNERLYRPKHKKSNTTKMNVHIGQNTKNEWQNTTHERS